MRFQIETKGHYDFIDITDQVASCIARSGKAGGTAFVFAPGTTCALITMEYEEGIIKDLTALLERLAPQNTEYEHHKRWGDNNGAAHIKSALMGTDVALPVQNRVLQIGTWQRIVFIDFDERPRTREVIMEVFG